jgi:hypothetical protein
LKWNFDVSRHVVPYFDAGAGLVFTNKDVPPGTWRGNFTTGGALGAHILGSLANFNAEVRYMHISNANVTAFDPGINTIQVRVGLGKFFGSR